MRYNKDLLFPLSLALLEFGVFLSNDAYLPALPNMMHDLNLTQSLSQSTLSIWFLGSASVQLFIGPLADRFGRRPVLLLGALAFVLASLVCAIVENFQILLFARFVQGCTVCTTIVGGYASIHESFSSKRAIQVIAIMGGITILAPALGPLFGAYLLHTTNDWRWIFYFLAIWGGVVGCFLFYKMPETLKKPVALNLLSNLKSYKAIIINKEWLRYSIMSCLLIFGFFLWILASPFLLIMHYHLSELYFGYAQTVIFSGFILGMQLCRWLIDRYPVRKIMLSFIAIALSSGAFAIFLVANNASIWPVIFSIAIVAVGASGANTPLSRLAVESSDSPMGQKVAMYSFFFSISGASAALVSGLLSSQSAMPILLLGFFGNSIAGLLVLIGYKTIVLQKD